MMNNDGLGCSVCMLFFFLVTCFVLQVIFIDLIGILCHTQENMFCIYMAAARIMTFRNPAQPMETNAHPQVADRPLKHTPIYNTDNKHTSANSYNETMRYQGNQVLGMTKLTSEARH